MTDGLLFRYGCLAFSILLVIIYFSKKRLNTIENKLYSWIIVTNLFGLLIDISCHWALKITDSAPLIAFAILRLYLVYLISWLVIFTVYIRFISYQKQPEQQKKLIKSIKKEWTIIYWILIIVMFLLPMHVSYNGTNGYTYGASINIIYVASGICIVAWLRSLLKNFKNIKQKRYLPLFVFIVFGAVVATIQMLNPSIILMTGMETFVSFMMYFTIENPDIQLLRELHKAREYAENSNNEKSTFLFNITQQLREPLREISRLSKDALMETDSEIIKSNLTEIKYSAKNALSLVNSVLDISELENRKISITAHKYQPVNLFNSLVRATKLQAKEKDLELRFNYDQSIPEYLSGDSLRLKQILGTLLENAVIHTDKGFIEMSVNSVIKYDVCRLIVTVEDSGKGIEVEQLNNLFDKSKNDTSKGVDDSQKNLVFIKTLVDLIGGTITVNSEIGKGSKFVVVVDQKIPTKQESELSKAVKQYENIYVNQDHVLVVTSDEKIEKKLTTLFKKFHVDYSIVKNGQECLEKIRNKESYQLILMDETLPKLSSVHTFDKLRTIDGFDIPVVLMTKHKDIETKDTYINIGFYDTIGVPIAKEEIKQILDKYIKMK